MRILFDVQIANPNLYKESNLEERLFFDRVFNYVHDRIWVLEDEINKEEAENSKTATVIYLSAGYSTKKYMAGFYRVIKFFKIIHRKNGFRRIPPYLFFSVFCHPKRLCS